jgi:class 3 adenylate cyclase
MKPSLCSSAREAIRAAVELQRSLREQADEATTFPLGVGIGIDSGEAVPTEGGYRGGALNLASRLCAIAKPARCWSATMLRTWRVAWTACAWRIAVRCG